MVRACPSSTRPFRSAAFLAAAILYTTRTLAAEPSPASTPPASTPPASTPPASTPPASAPPASAPPASQATDGNPLAAEHRRRYEEAKKAYDRGQIAEALAMWEAIYREMHPSRAFRLAYNLGVAHLDLGDVTHAAERFETFIAEFDVRKARNELSAKDLEELDPLVAGTHAKLSELRRSRGRIQINAASVAVVARVGGMPPRVAGFTAWVSPGTYTVVFGEGTPTVERKTVTVKAGAIEELTPSPPPPTIRKIETQVVTKRPFSPVYIYVSSALTAAAVTVTIYGNVKYRAIEKDAAARTDTAGDAELKASAERARWFANGGLGATIGLGVVTAGLITYYFVGSKEVRETKSPVPFVAPTPSGALAGVTVSF